MLKYAELLANDNTIDHANRYVKRLTHLTQVLHTLEITRQLREGKIKVISVPSRFEQIEIEE